MTKWFVDAKRPFAGPEAVLAYLARYTHRVAISNSRLIRADDSGVTFTWKDYRVEGRARCKTMTLARRRVDPPLPAFTCSRAASIASGIMASSLTAARATNLTRARALLGAREPCATVTADPAGATAPPCLTQPCPCCGGRMIIIERFARGSSPAHRPSAPTAVIRSTPMKPMALTRCHPVARHDGWSCAGRAGARSNGMCTLRVEHRWAPSRQLGTAMMPRSGASTPPLRWPGCIGADPAPDLKCPNPHR